MKGVHWGIGAAAVAGIIAGAAVGGRLAHREPAAARTPRSRRGRPVEPETSGREPFAGDSTLLAAEPERVVLPYLRARDQGETEHCFAFAVVAAMESWILANHPEWTHHLPLSEADLLGLTSRQEVPATLEAVERYGIVEAGEGEGEGEGEERRGLGKRARRAAADRFWRIRFSMLRHPNIRDSMTAALDAGNPLVVAIRVDRSFLDPEIPIPYPEHDFSSESLLPSGHAVCIVGYRPVERHWIAKNSMGPYWGQDGCFEFRFGYRPMVAEHSVYRIDAVVPPSSIPGR